MTPSLKETDRTAAAAGLALGACAAAGMIAAVEHTGPVGVLRTTLALPVTAAFVAAVAVGLALAAPAIRQLRMQPSIALGVVVVVASAAYLALSPGPTASPQLGATPSVRRPAREAPTQRPVRPTPPDRATPNSDDEPAGQPGTTRRQPPRQPGVTQRVEDPAPTAPVRRTSPRSGSGQAPPQIAPDPAPEPARPAAPRTAAGRRSAAGAATGQGWRASSGTRIGFSSRSAAAV